MTRHLTTALLSVAMAATAGCADPTVASLVGAMVSTASKEVQVTVYGPATQVALIAAGGLNYRLAARPDETPVGGAKIQYGDGKTAIADGTGRAKLELPGGSVARLTVSYKLKSGTTVSLPAAAVTDGSSEDLDAANVMVASVAFAKNRAGSPIEMRAAITAMREALANASTLPTLTDSASASRAFDSLAPASLKSTLAGGSPGQVAVVGTNGATYRVPAGR